MGTVINSLGVIFLSFIHFAHFVEVQIQQSEILTKFWIKWCQRDKYFILIDLTHFYISTCPERGNKHNQDLKGNLHQLFE